MMFDVGQPFRDARPLDSQVCTLTRSEAMDDPGPPNPGQAGIRSTMGPGWMLCCSVLSRIISKFELIARSKLSLLI